MITVGFREDDAEKIIEFTAKGHAGTAKHGEDLVCACASILAYTLIDNLMSLSGRQKEAVVSIEPGDTKAIIPLDAEYSVGKIIAHAIEKGYRLLASQYPQAVAIKRIAHDKGRKGSV
ncbi:MAG: ribosomal-processing cysteine protease Prp [Clostridia bacterium]|nr:ribosomal-processing cysteine protease Prp [Clostridia bacterium]